MSDPLGRAAGISIDAFAATYWATSPLLCRAMSRPDGAFSDLFSLAAVDELLSERGLRTPFVRMTRDGNVLAPGRFTRSGGAGAEIADQIADDKVLAEFGAGATLVLQGLHRTWPPIAEFAVALAAQLGHPVQINAYITPPQSQGFGPHYDVHDVFVLQFAGRKRWRVHEPVLAAPLRDQPWDSRKAAVSARAAGPPLIETELETGDSLYLPRGYIHAATSLGEVSGHLTVGVHPVTRHALATELFATLAEDVELRRSLPVGVDLSDPQAIGADLDATISAVHAAIERLDRDAVARGIGRHLAAATRPAPLAPLRQISAAAALGAASPVRLRRGLRLTLQIEDDQLVIGFSDKTLRLPAVLTEAVRAATSGARVTADSLPGVDSAGGVALLRQFLGEGIVVPE
jgi:hypothetical protein